MGNNRSAAGEGGEGENRHDTCGDRYFRRVRKWARRKNEKQNMPFGKKWSLEINEGKKRIVKNTCEKK